jgi:predicted DNA-binding protein
MILTPTGKEKSLDVILTVRMPAKLKASLEKLAEKDRRDLSDYLRIVLEDHIARKRR